MLRRRRILIHSLLLLWLSRVFGKHLPDHERAIANPRGAVPTIARNRGLSSTGVRGEKKPRMADRTEEIQEDEEGGQTVLLIFEYPSEDEEADAVEESSSDEDPSVEDEGPSMDFEEQPAPVLKGTKSSKSSRPKSSKSKKTKKARNSKGSRSKLKANTGSGKNERRLRNWS